MQKSRFCVFFLLGLLTLGVQAQTPEPRATGERPLHVTAQLNPQKLNPEQGTELVLTLSLPDGFRAYAEQFRLNTEEGSQFKLGRFHISPLQDFFDEITKSQKKGVVGTAKLVAPIEAPADFQDEKNPFILKLTYQACTKTYCLFPITIDVPVLYETISALSAHTPASLEVKTEEGRRISDFFQKPFHEVLARESLWLVFIFIFIAGILTSFTPCIFPMIPITLAVLGRQAHARSKFQNYLVAHVYVLGIALTYSILGVVAAGTGMLFGSFMSSPWVLGFVCLVFLAMSLSMFGVFDLQPPHWLQKRLGQAHGDGYFGAFLTGAIAGIVASPCVGPVLVGILTYVAQTKSLALGFGALFVFALGMGQLFLFLGVFSGATKLLPKSGEWMEGVKHLFGLLMLGAFYYYLSFLVPIRVFEGFAGLGFILLGSLKGAFERNELLNTGWKKVRKGLCQALILLGALLVAVAVLDLQTSWNSPVIKEASSQSAHGNWQDYSDALMTQAAADGKPVLIDFYADWCAACLQLEQQTFTDPRFQMVAAPFVLLRFDATQGSPELDALKKKYQIMGLPTVLFFDRKGQWRQELTLTEFEDATKFIPRLEKTLQAN